MKILIYIEPQIELDAPQHKDVWVDQWVPRLVQGLVEGFPNDLTAVAVAADHLVERAPILDGATWVGVSQSDAIDLQNENGLDGRVKRYLEGADCEEGRLHARRIARVLGDFVPDCIIGLSDARFLSAAYPEAGILQHEYGQFSRSPFPESFFFDPCGAGGSAWLNRHWREVVETWRPSKEQLDVTRTLMTGYKNTIKEFNPFENFLETARSNFARLATLPLHLHGQPLYDGLTNVVSPLQLMQAALEVLPPRTGLLVASHPGQRPVDPGVIHYLLDRYPAFLMPGRDISLASPSQYLVPHSDHVICVSSSVAALTLFWGNPYIAAGNGYLKFLEAANWSSTWPEKPQLSIEQRERLLAWLIFKFLALDSNVRSGEWMSAVVRSCLAGKAGGTFADFFDKIPEHDVEFVEENWVNKLAARNSNLLLKNSVEQYSQAVNAEDDLIWLNLEPTLDKAAAKTPLSADSASFYFHKGMASINRKGDMPAAAEAFILAREAFSALCASQLNAHYIDMYWQSAFHVCYALRNSKESPEYMDALLRLTQTPPQNIPEMPPSLRSRLTEVTS